MGPGAVGANVSVMAPDAPIDPRPTGAEELPVRPDRAAAAGTASPVARPEGAVDGVPPPLARPLVGPALLLFLAGFAPGFVGRSPWTILAVTIGFVGYKAWTGREVWHDNIAVKGRDVLAPMVAATLVVQGILAASLHGMGVLMGRGRGGALAAGRIEPVDLAWALGIPLLAAVWAELRVGRRERRRS